MSFERTIHGPMKWVPPPSAADNGHAAVPPVSPTPSYATASSTSMSTSSAPSTPAMSCHRDYYDPRWAQHLSPHGDPRLPNGASWANGGPASMMPSPPPWTTSPLSRSPLPYHPTPSPGGASHASAASVASRSGYDGDRDDTKNNNGGGSRPSSTSSTLSSTSSSAGTRTGNPTRGGTRDTTTAALPAASRAMALLEEAVEEQASLAVAPRGKKGKQQCASQLRALNLFDEQYSHVEEGDAPTTSTNTSGGGGGSGRIDDFKSEVDKIRQRGAGMRALALLNDTASGEKHHTSSQLPTSSLAGAGAGSGTAPLTARRAAQLAHEKRQAEKERVQAKLKKDLEMYGRRTPKIAVPVRKEALAESTRPKKAQTDEDVRDPETVSGMKCPLHWEREREAQVKALKLLNDESAAIVTIL